MYVLWLFPTIAKDASKTTKIKLDVRKELTQLKILCGNNAILCKNSVNLKMNRIKIVIRDRVQTRDLFRTIQQQKFNCGFILFIYKFHDLNVFLSFCTTTAVVHVE